MSVVSVGSGYIVGYRPICSYDSRWLICASNTVVKVYSLKTGECVHDLRGHTKRVTGLLVHPKNKLQILSCSMDETIIVWDYNDGVQLKKYKLHAPIGAMLPMPSSGTANLILMMKNKSDSFDLCSHELNSDTPDLATPPDARTTFLLSDCSGDERCVDVGCQARYVVSVNKLKVYVRDLQSNQFLKYDSQNGHRHFLCVACHPTENCFATGCSDGMIITWRRFLGCSPPIRSVSHWHALPVMDLRFSVEGTRLFSGGHECTLVTWQLQQQTKDFLPRLGAPIKNISVSPDNRLIIASLSDNEILVIDSSSSSVVQAMTGITFRQLGYQRENPYPAGLRYDPNKKALVSNGKPGHLQFYCLHTNKPLFNLDVVGINYVSPENLDNQEGVAEVQKASFNDTGEWLATLQLWNIQGFTPEIYLKFWFYDSKKQTYILSTMIASPHQKSVTCLEFSHLDQTVDQSQEGSTHTQLAVTCSKDKMFKLWGLNKHNKWNCELEGFYRDYYPSSASFTEDSSLLAVAFKHLVTIWDPVSKSLQRVLQNPLDESVCRQLQFGRKSSFHLLVSYSHTRLTVWNILTSTVLWSVDITVSCLVSDPDSEMMAAFTEDKCLYVFGPSQPQPVYQKKDVTEETVEHATFIPHLTPATDLPPSLQWQTSSQLFFMNRNQELLSIVEKDEHFTGLKRPSSMTIPESFLDNEFSSVIGKRRKVEQLPEPMETSGNLPSYSSPLLRELTNIPAAVCPPVASFTGKFIRSLLSPRVA
ncbi:WD repeat-containing protein 75-like [Argonauta hians]